VVVVYFLVCRCNPWIWLICWSREKNKTLNPNTKHAWNNKPNSVTYRTYVFMYVRKYTYTCTYICTYVCTYSGSGDLVVSMLASGTQDRGFEKKKKKTPGRSRRIFRAKKSTSCLPSKGK
jgi:hypothetical protein